MILSASLLLVFIQTASAFYSKSLAMFSYAGLIILNAFSFLCHLVNPNGMDKGFRKAQLISVLLNVSAILVLSLIILSKAFLRMAEPKDINMLLAVTVTFIVFLGLIICFFVSKKFLIQSLLSFTIITGFSIPVSKNIAFLDSYLSIFFVVCIIMQSTALIKKPVEKFKIL